MPVLLLASIALSGCSIALPSFLSEGDETGSIARPAPISDRMTGQDRRAADAAMAAALDSTPVGKPHAWANPASGNNGAFAALAEGYRSGAVLCRRFSAEMTIDRAALPPMRGTACRTGAEPWTIERIGPAKDA